MGGDCVIDRVRLHWLRMPVSVVFSYGEVRAFPFVVVRLSAGGAEGVGEAGVPPTDSFLDFASTLVGADARRLDSLLPEMPSDHERILCEGVSIALHDLVGRLSGLPAHVLLGGAPSDRVALMPCLFPHNSEEAREAAQRFLAQGYRYLKVKLAGLLSEDLARVRAVRSATDKGITLQGDANCGYKDLESARRAVETLGAAGLDVFEDPLEGPISDYARLRGGPGAKVMVDAHARRTGDLLAVLRAGAADAIGVHADQPGSLTRALRHVRLAQTFGVPAVIGGTGYCGIGSAAYQHLTAVATPDGPCGELGGFFDHGMPKSLVRAPLPMDNGFVTLPRRAAGLGVELDEDALREFEEGCKEWRG
ncbi:MAG: mandelate racemase/muconate lactonizing enzyme family protein [Planctomycetota bacterium]